MGGIASDRRARHRTIATVLRPAPRRAGRGLRPFAPFGGRPPLRRRGSDGGQPCRAAHVARRRLVRIEGDACSLLLTEAPDVTGLATRRIEVLWERSTDTGLHAISDRLGDGHSNIRREEGTICWRLGVDGRAGVARGAAMIGLVTSLPASHVERRAGSSRRTPRARTPHLLVGRDEQWRAPCGWAHGGGRTYVSARPSSMCAPGDLEWHGAGQPHRTWMSRRRSAPPRVSPGSGSGRLGGGWGGFQGAIWWLCPAFRGSGASK